MKKKCGCKGRGDEELGTDTQLLFYLQRQPVLPNAHSHQEEAKFKATIKQPVAKQKQLR